MSIVREVKDIKNFSHLVLPGVGSFGHCAKSLYLTNLIKFLNKWTFKDKMPILGICVGMQLFADLSEESDNVKGLGWIPGKIKKIKSFSKKFRVPHVGWNSVNFNNLNKLNNNDFYFDHSYAFEADNYNDVFATFKHGKEYCAAIQKENILGVQFHPEKSQESGLDFIKYFLFK